MVLLDKLWDDVAAGPLPDRGLGKLRKNSGTPLKIKVEGEGSAFQKSLSMPAAGTPPNPETPLSSRKENVWRSVFSPGSNPASKGMGANFYDKPQPNSPSVYDWFYSKDCKSEHR